jgi:hypothetical protein
MSNELTLITLLPRLSDTCDARNKTFVGIDFGTSTSVASFCIIGFSTRERPMDHATGRYQCGHGGSTAIAGL